MKKICLLIPTLFIFLLFTSKTNVFAVYQTSPTDTFSVYLPLVFSDSQNANTSPHSPSNPSPYDGATEQNVDLTLSWIGGDPDGDTVTYDVYLAADDNTPDVLVSDNQTGESFSPGVLNYSTTYYWQIIATDEHGDSSTGPVWSFTTGDAGNDDPNVPSDPSPADGSIDQDIGLTLSWIGGDPDGDTVTYDVYLAADDSTPDVLVSDNQTGESFSPGVLNYSTTYYWQIIATDEHDASSTGPVWSFTTGDVPNNDPNIPSDPNPSDGAVDQDIGLDLSWIGGDPDGDAVTYDVYLAADDNTPDILVSDNQTGESFSPGVLNTNTSYYWQIIATDEHGASSTGPVWNFVTGESILPAASVFVPAGEFMMGCDPAHNNFEVCAPDELPLHPIYLNGFYIDKYEITNAQYSQCVNDGFCTIPHSNSSVTRPSYYDNPTYANYPVIYVSWFQAQDYCAWAGKRLPTEAEWEKAARGALDTRAFPWGDQTPTCVLANFIFGGDIGLCVGDTTFVGSYPGGASLYEAMDMSGNVFEWINDWYQSDYYSTSPYTNPLGPDEGSERVLRGGAWSYSSDGMRVASRVYDFPEHHGYSVGFRCALDSTP